MSTKTLVKDRALERLGVKIRGQSAQPKDIDRIESSYTEVYARLKRKDLAVWAEAGTLIPDEIVPYLVLLMALNAADDFGISNARYSRIVSQTGRDGALAMREIRSVITPKYESTEEVADY